jgi:hypothetical protein
MAEHRHHQDDGPLPDSVAVGHETSDAQSGPIIRFLIFLAVFSVAIAALMVVFHDYLERREAAEKASRYPIAAGRPRALPPPPRLQTEPFQNIKDLRAACSIGTSGSTGRPARSAFPSIARWRSSQSAGCRTGDQRSSRQLAAGSRQVPTDRNRRRRAMARSHP